MALIRKTPQSTASVTAAARPVNIRNPTEAAAIKAVSGTREQAESWRFYRSMSELNYPTNYLGRNVSRFKFPVGVIPANDLSASPSVPDLEDRDALYDAAERIMFNLTPEIGDLHDLAETYVMNMAVAGEGWLVARELAGEIRWSFFSVREFGPISSSYDEGSVSYARFPTGSTSLPDDSYVPRFVRRVWQPSPELQAMADTSTFAVLPKLKSLSILDRSLTARIINTLTQTGFLFMPSQLTLAGAPGAPTGDGNQVDDPFAHKVLKILQAQHDSGDSSAFPSLIRGDAALGDAIKFITMDRSIDHVELELRSEQRSEIAKGMFLPPEVIEGMGGMSHWSSWSVSDSAFAHILPYAQGFADVMTQMILWPALRQWIVDTGASYDESDIRRHRIVPDGSDVITRPNEAEDGRQLHDRLVISDRSLRDRSGVSEVDAPSPEEYVRQIGRKINHPFLATWGLPIHDEIDWDKVREVVRGVGSPGVGSVDEGHRPADSSDPAGAPGEGDSEGDDQLAELLSVAAPGFVLAARKKVGAKVRARCEPHAEIHARVKKYPNEVVLRVLDEGEREQIGVPTALATEWFEAELSMIRSALPMVPAEATSAFVAALAKNEAEGDQVPIRDLAVTSLTPTRKD